MATFQRFVGHRPIVAVSGTIPLPIKPADIVTALGPHLATTREAHDTIANIVNTQISMKTLKPGTTEYVNRFKEIQAGMRGMGLYPIRAAVGPSVVVV